MNVSLQCGLVQVVVVVQHRTHLLAGFDFGENQQTEVLSSVGQQSLVPVSGNVNFLLDVAHHFLDLDFFSQIAHNDTSEVIVDEFDRQNEFLVVCDFVEFVVGCDASPTDIVVVAETVFEVPQFVFATLEETSRLG